MQEILKNVWSVESLIKKNQAIINPIEALK